MTHGSTPTHEIEALESPTGSNLQLTAVTAENEGSTGFQDRPVAHTHT
jgi:hypothetical protein